MQKFTFKLKRILDIRKLQEDLKLAEWGREQRRLAAEKDKLRLFQTEAESQSNQIRIEQAVPFPVWAKNENTKYFRRIQRVVEFQTASVENQTLESERAKNEFLSARRDTRSMELLHDKQLEEWKSEFNRNEGNTLDEIGNRRQEGEL